MLIFNNIIILKSMSAAIDPLGGGVSFRFEAHRSVSQFNT
jgi:hypothetical protein